MIRVQLSIILCTWNNVERLRDTLNALSECESKTLDWELIVVNNNCTDNTDDVVASFHDQLPVVYIHEKRQGLSRARNAGLNAARGDYLIFIDDDITPSPQWLSTYRNAFERFPQGHYFGGSVESIFESVIPPDELLQFAPWSVRGLELGDNERILEREMFLAANWACPRAAIVAAGGFDEELGLSGSGPVNVGEESDLQTRLRQMGYKALYLPEARIGHFVPASKCTLKHVAARTEASAMIGHSESAKEYTGPRIGRVPRWLYRDCAQLWLRWSWARLIGRSGIAEYLAFRARRGWMRAHKELNRK